MKSRILICGGRDFNDWEFFRDKMEEIARKCFERTVEDEYLNYLYAVTIICGGANGVDAMAEEWAMVNWASLYVFKADWEKHGKAAGPIRNQQMLDEGKPDLVIAFPGGAGTADMVRRAKKAEVEVWEVYK
jgi:predicted Rossmann-fold nucleotide-binding protein